MYHLIIRCLILLVLLLVHGPALAQAPAVPQALRHASAGATRPGPLANAPFPVDAAHAARLQAMPAGGWVDLGAPAADPVCGRARGRSWTPRMIYVDYLRVALLAGEGIHGYVKPDGYYMDDLWAYDMQRHRWICVYRGAHTATLALHRDSRGFEVDAQGRDVPVGYLAHGYNNMTYVPETRSLMIVPIFTPWWTAALPQRLTWLDPQWAGNLDKVGPIIANRSHPVFYHIDTHTWERRFSSVQLYPPGANFYHYSALEYIPTKRMPVWLDATGVFWYYDSTGKTWVHSGHPLFQPGYDVNAVYSAVNDTVYYFRGSLWAFDVQTGTTTARLGEHQPDVLGNTNFATVTYDSRRQIIVYFDHRAKDIRTYDPVANTWSATSDPIPAVPYPRLFAKSVNGVYDPVHDVHLYYFADDSQDNGFMLAYRARGTQ